MAAENSKLAQTKAKAIEQKLALKNMSESGLTFLRTMLIAATTFEVAKIMPMGSQNSANLRARCAMMAVDSSTVRILDQIFGGVTKDARRAVLDDKSQRTLGLWGVLATTFFNSDSWEPQPGFIDTRVADIDPSKPPPPPGWTCTELRYTLCNI